MHTKLHAGALNFAIVLALMAVTLALLLMNWQNQHNELRIRGLHTLQLRQNVYSAWVLHATQNYLSDYNEYTRDLFSEGNDSVTVISRMWGGYQVASICALRRNHSQRKALFYGQALQGMPALWLAPGRYALQVAGKTHIQGNAYLSENGVKAAYLEGKAYLGTKMVYGNLHTGNYPLPELEPEQLAYLQRIANQRFLDSDSLASWPAESINHPWHKATMVLQAEDGHIPLDTVKGNVIIFSKTTLEVREDQYLEDVVLTAPKIVIHEVKPNYARSASIHRLHAIATDSLVLESGVHLKYPSSLIVVAKPRAKPFIHLQSMSLVEGVVAALVPPMGRVTYAHIRLDSGNVVVGQVYTTGNLEVQSTVIGSTLAQNIVLHTRAGIYDNHLLHAVLNADSLVQPFAGLMYQPSLPKATDEQHGNKHIYPALWLP